jgi:hypothetical protein
MTPCSLHRGASACASILAWRSATIIACAAARSVGKVGDRGDSAGVFTKRGNHIRRQKQGEKLYPSAVGRQLATGLRQSMPERR